MPSGAGNSHRKLIAWAAAGALAAVAMAAVWVADRNSAGHAQPSDRPVQAFVGELSKEASPVQLAALADGTVTQEEYDAAIDATAACLEERGAPVGLRVTRSPGRAVKGTTELTWLTQQPPGDLHDALINCYRVHSSAVGLKFQEQNRPSAEELSARGAAVDECLTTSGYPNLRGLHPVAITEKYGGGSSEHIAYIECRRALGW